MGGDPAKAEKYVKSLEQYDEVIGSKARALIMPEDADFVGFWKKVLEKHPGDSRVLEELGKTYFKIQKGEEGAKYLREAITSDPVLSYLHLDIARYYLYTIMSDRSAIDTYLPLFETAIYDFLATDPNAPLKAWATGWLGRLKSNAGNKEEGENLLKQAETLDPLYSKATAIPSQDLFTPPDEIPYYHSYMFQPF
jgi:tetratricopeptide (TPR) repeat protein